MTTDLTSLCYVCEYARVMLYTYTVKLAELSKQADQCSFPKRIVDTSMESESREVFGQYLYPLTRDPTGHKIALIYNNYQMLVCSVLFDVPLYEVLSEGSFYKMLCLF